MQWIPAHDIYPGKWVDPTDFSMPYIGDGVEFEDVQDMACPDCGARCTEDDGYNCPECGEPLMW
jgi:DNA-directed RNA polymerase subunit RPC12/RpoP